MNSFIPVQERWDTFLAKITEGFHAILGQAEQLLPDILELQEFDTTPFGVAWQGIQSQANSFIDKIQHTWQDKVSDLFDEVRTAKEELLDQQGGDIAGFHNQYYKLYYAAMDKGLSQRHLLQKELKKYEVRTFAESARKLQRKAAEILSKNFVCKQCQATLPVRTNFFRAYYHPCDYCQTVNTFEPGTIARQVEHFALHPLAEEKAMEEYMHYWDLQEKYSAQRSDEPRLLAAATVLEAYKQYAEKYLRARIEIIPDLEKEYEKDLKAKLEHVSKWRLGSDN